MKNNANIITGDILKVVKNFEDEKFKLIITSPPYNIGKNYEKKQVLQEYLDWQEQIISTMPRILNNQGSIIWQVGNYIDKTGGERNLPFRYILLSNIQEIWI